MLRGALAALLFLCAGAALAAEPALQIEALASPVKVRLRGLSAFSDQIAWASGREGTVLRTRDGGKHWDVFNVPGAAELDFRDVQAFGAEAALVMGAGPGDASRVYRTDDGGRTWTLVLRNPDAEGFFDCMDFDGEEGRLLGDPVNGRFQVYASSDGGRSWRRTKGPKAEEGEAAFAASGTCLRLIPQGTLLVTGGARSRFHFLADRLLPKDRWMAEDSDVGTGASSSGLFSVALRGTEEAISVGGDYEQEKAAGGALGLFVSAEVERMYGNRETEPYLSRYENDLEVRRSRNVPFDFVIAYKLDTFEGQPSGYRSAVECASLPNPICIATGPGGTDVLPARDMSKVNRPRIPIPDSNPARFGQFEVKSAWQWVSDEGYDSVDIAGGVAWFSGDEGRLGRLTLPAPQH